MSTLRRVPFVLPLLALACQRPDLEAYRKSPAPVSVELELPADVPERDRQGKEYAAVLRARLATRVEVVAEGTPAPPQADRLKVQILAYKAHRSPSPGAVGVATGVTVGVISGASGHRHAAWNGFWWGWFFGHAAAHDRNREDSLGYRPMDVEARVTYTRADGRTILADFDLTARDIFRHLEPLPRAEQDDPARIAEVEARALAKAIIRQLDRTLELRPSEARWFRGKEN